MFNRREVLLGGGAATAALVSGCRLGRSAWLVLSETEASTLAVLCDQIIPADEWPSASQAGVITFIDRQLTGPYRRHCKAYRRGIEETEALARSVVGTDLAEASPGQQVYVVKALEQRNPAFFEMVRQHTMQGYYGSPRHGGNKDAVSYRMLGLDVPLLRGRAQYDLTAGRKP